MQIDTDKLLANWKSTAMGALLLIIASSSAVHFDAQGHFAMTAKDWFTVAMGALGAGVGLLQKDAGTVAAVVPGEGVVNVPSHEVPDNPAAKVVK